MLRDEEVFLIGEDIADPFGGSRKVTLGLSTEFGATRVRNTPISESALVGSAIGAAIMGMRPVAEIMYFDFITLAMDMIVNMAAKIRYMTGGQVAVPLVLRTHGGNAGGAGAHHSQCLEAWFFHVPGLKMVAPATPADAKGLLKSAIRDNNPVIFIEHEKLYNVKGTVPEGEYLTPFGQAAVLRKGKDVTIVGYSYMVLQALSAAEELSQRGIDAEVIDLRTLHPLDEQTIFASVEKTSRAVVVTEACERGSIASHVAVRISEEVFDYLDAPVRRVAAANVPMPFANGLEKEVIPQPIDIVLTVEQLLVRK